jgi:hypothetical protein
MLAASYAAAKGLTVTAVVADWKRFPVEAEERRDLFLVGQADAAVVVWAERDPAVRRVLALVERKGVPVHVIGGRVRERAGGCDRCRRPGGRTRADTG